MLCLDWGCVVFRSSCKISERRLGQGTSWVASLPVSLRGSCADAVDRSLSILGAAPLGTQCLPGVLSGARCRAITESSGLSWSKWCELQFHAKC